MDEYDAAMQNQMGKPHLGIAMEHGSDVQGREATPGSGDAAAAERWGYSLYHTHAEGFIQHRYFMGKQLV